jgi:hypothetical protein
LQSSRARYQALVQGQIAKLLAQVGHCQLNDRLFPIIDIVKCALDRIFLDGWPRLHNPIYHDFNVIFGDHGLWVDFHDVLSNVANADDVNDWELKSQAGHHKAIVSAQGFLDATLVRS